jgi:hypothetical protein
MNGGKPRILSFVEGRASAVKFPSPALDNSQNPRKKRGLRLLNAGLCSFHHRDGRDRRTFTYK